MNWEPRAGELVVFRPGERMPGVLPCGCPYDDLALDSQGPRLLECAGRVLEVLLVYDQGEMCLAFCQCCGWQGVYSIGEFRFVLMYPAGVKSEDTGFLACFQELSPYEVDVQQR